MDGRVISARQSDVMLTTGSRLFAEPPPPLPDGALGVCYTGAWLGGRVPQQTDIDAALAKVIADPGLLSVAERANIATILSKFSGRAAGPTGGVGVTSNDAAPKKATDWAREAARTVAANVAATGAVQKTYSDFWDKQNKKMTAEIE